MHLMRDVQTLVRPSDADQDDFRASRNVDDTVDVDHGCDLPIIEHVEGGRERGLEGESNDAHGAYFFACLKAL